MNITVINTGGTFNKVYNTITGQLDVASNSESLQSIIKHCHNIEFDVHNVISKDSLDINDLDRQLLCEYLEKTHNDAVIIIHGTDTISQTAQCIANHCFSKKVILTGAMTPMSIDEVEATINFSTAVGALNASMPDGVYIAMHGIVSPHEKVFKDKEVGLFFKQK